MDVTVEEIEENICRVSSETVETESLREMLLRAGLNPKTKDDVIFSHPDADFSKESKPVISEFIVSGKKSDVQFYIDSVTKIQRPYPKK